MKRLALICLLFVSSLAATTLYAQSTFPASEGERIKYNAYIEMPRSYVSGIMILMNDNNEIKGSLFNEFGVTALDFSYFPKKNKVKLHNVVSMMDKWYIRRVLRKDLAHMMTCLQTGETAYQNERHHITYKFTPLADEVLK